MDDVSFSKKANISVISRFDQQVKDIVISASQVALYVFDARRTKWIKRKVEGACFIYKRKSSPKYGIFILNRLDTNNFIEHMTSTMEIQLQEPYILYRNTFKTVYGIWFYEKAECTAMASVFQRILTELKEKEKEDQDDSPFMKDKACIAELPEENGHDSNSQKPNGQPESVRQFFAKASKEATKPLPIIGSGSRCTPFQSVVHIEKAHKSDHLECSPSSVIGNFPKATACFGVRKTDLVMSGEHEASVQAIENNIRCMNLNSSANYDKFPQSLPSIDDSSSCSELPELISPGMLLKPSDLSDTVSESERISKNNLLTKTQMIQAMEYLLKNDSQFIDKLYDAYLKSSKTN